MLSKERAAYWAGFFDGEGCVAIITHGRPGKYYQLKLNVSQAERSILDELQTDFGGNVRLHSPANGKHRESWAWHISDNGALNFLDHITPYLKIKKTQARLGMEFQVRKNLETRSHRGPYNPLTKEQIDYRHAMYEQMRRLKGRL